MDQFDLEPHYFMEDPFMSGGDPDPHIDNMIDSYIVNYDKHGLDDDFSMFNNDLPAEEEFADVMLSKLDEQEAEQANAFTTMNEEHTYAAASSHHAYAPTDILQAATDASDIYSYDYSFDQPSPNPVQFTQQKQTTFAPSFNRQPSNSGSSQGRRIIAKAPTFKSQIISRNGTARFNRLTPPSSISLSSSSSPTSSPSPVTSPTRSPVGERQRKYLPLNLTEEEKRVSKQMNYIFPDYEPLTRAEKSNLAKVRRKIRNKISAQNSRKKKQDYVEELERELDIVRQDLREEIEQREREKSSMMAQIRKLQTALAQSAKRGKQAGTCFAVLILSACLLVAPNISPLIYKNIPIGDEEMLQETAEEIRNDVLPGRSRTLMEYSTPVLGEAPFQCPPISLHSARYGQEAEESYDARCPLPSKKARSSSWRNGARFVNNQYQKRAQYNNNVAHSAKKDWVYPSPQHLSIGPSPYEAKQSPDYTSSSSASSPEYDIASAYDEYGSGGGPYGSSDTVNRTKQPQVRTQHVYRTMYKAEPF